MTYPFVDLACSRTHGCALGSDVPNPNPWFRSKTIAWPDPVVGHKPKELLLGKFVPYMYEVGPLANFIYASSVRTSLWSSHEIVLIKKKVKN